MLVIDFFSTKSKPTRRPYLKKHIPNHKNNEGAKKVTVHSNIERLTKSEHQVRPIAINFSQFQSPERLLLNTKQNRVA